MKEKKPKLFVEEVTERYLNHISASTIRKVKPYELRKAKAEYKKAGKCDHNKNTLIVYDEAGWLYDFRFCGICGGGLGAV